MARRYRLIVNPKAGRKGGLAVNASDGEAAVAALRAVGVVPEVVETAHAGHATALARDAVDAGYDVVIAAGGDGTVREAAVGLLHTTVPLGIMPLGSVMNVARMLGIPRDSAGAAAAIATHRAAAIDVGRAGEHYFLEAAGVGLDAIVFRYGNALDRGHWRYAGSAFRAALSYRPTLVTVEIDGRTIERSALMVTVANGPYCGAGLPFAPAAVVDDHRLDVLVYGAMPKLALARGMLRQMRHRCSFGEAYRGRAESFRARDVRVDGARPLRGHADAAPIGTTPLEFGLLEGALHVLVGWQDAALQGERPAVGRS